MGTGVEGRGASFPSPTVAIVAVLVNTNGFFGFGSYWPKENENGLNSGTTIGSGSGLGSMRGGNET